MSYKNINPEFDEVEFLEHYWQQKPLLIKNYFSNFEDILEAEELAGLALEESIESRLVQNPGEQPYQLSHGPFSEETFLNLPESHWTLLVQAVDQIVPEIAALKTAFSFLPSWRMDDVMISCATPGGGVGPHFDHYDVFLVQGGGSRRWKLGEHCHNETEIDHSSGLKLIKNFEPKQEFILESGDVLYIPPGISHWGTAVESGLCYSIGFRAPSHGELLEAYSDELIDQANDFQRYRDSVINPGLRAGEIEQEALKTSWEALQASMADEGLYAEAFGKLITQPRYQGQHYALTPPMEKPQLLELLAADTEIIRHPGSRFAWRQEDAAQGIVVYVDGEGLKQPLENIKAIERLCDLTIDNISGITCSNDADQWQILLLSLLNRGALLVLPSQASEP